MRARLLPLLVGLLTLAVTGVARAGAGGGSSGFGGGGGGGGGGFSGGGGSGGSSCTGRDCAIGGLVVAGIVLAVVLFVVVPALIAARRARRRRQERVRRVELASAEAADDDAAFAADAVRAAAAALFVECQDAWDRRDRERLRELVGADLFVEWTRRLDDFQRRGWHNRVSVVGEPSVEYVGLVNRAEDREDRVTVRIAATTRDFVEDRHGGRIMRRGERSELTTVAEYWTLAKRDGDGWRLESIEQDREGAHHLDAEIIATPWGDETRLRDEAVAERAVAEAAPADVRPAELADLDFDGPARAAAMDLALVDGRFDPDLIEASVRRAVAAWAQAVDGEDGPLEAVARPEAVRELLHPGDATAATRLVVRGPRIERVRIAALDAAAEPPALAVEVDVRGRRYLEDRDTAAVLDGSRERDVAFTERWTLTLDGPDAWPWRVAGTTAPAPIR